MYVSTHCGGGEIKSTGTVLEFDQRAKPPLLWFRWIQGTFKDSFDEGGESQMSAVRRAFAYRLQDAW